MPIEIPEQTISNNKYRILIIEDDPTVLFYLTEIFKSEYTIIAAQNGKIGIKKAFEEMPDIIISDILMPKMNGFDCCKILKSDEKTKLIPIIILTALTDDESNINSMELGADAYYSKPVKPRFIKGRVSQLINSRESLKKTYKEYSVNKDSFGESNSIFLQKVNKIISENISNSDFNVTALANSLDISQPTLYRKIKHFADYSIAEYIKKIRIEYASKLLKSNIYSVQEVAKMVGYIDIPTFRRHFTEAYKCTPSKYMMLK